MGGRQRASRESEDFRCRWRAEASELDGSGTGSDGTIPAQGYPAHRHAIFRFVHSMTTEQRLVNVEIKLSYTEDLLDELNLTIYRQQQQIDVLIREVTALRKQLPEAGNAAGATVDETPPHY
jgi:SlyX protein